MIITATKIPDVWIIESLCFEDHRGSFVRYWDSLIFGQDGIGPFVQDNISISKSGVLRGLHYQERNPQGKLVAVHSGAIFDVAVDIRPNSHTFGEWVGVDLTEDDNKQLWIPPGLAHGFCVTEGPAKVHYRCTAPYDADDQCGIRWDDPRLCIDWPVENPILSDRDSLLPYK